MRVALYARVSTEEQAVHGLSIGVQQDTLRSWANGNNYTIVGMYTDAGISARKAASKRPALQQMLDDVRAGKVDMIAFTKLDRWFRNVAEYYKVQAVLDAYNVSWKALEEDYETATSAGRFKVNIMLSVAESEADRTAERIKVVNRNKREKGMCHNGHPTLGIKVKDGKIVEDPETADIVRDIFDYYVRTQSITQTSRYLLDKYKIVRAYRNLKSLLKNRRYIGYADNGELLYAPIVDPTTFDLAQEIMTQRSARHSGDFTQKHTYIFSTITVCGECGRRLTYRINRRHNKSGTTEYVYGRCPRHASGTCGNATSVREDILEAYMLDHLIMECEKYNAIVAQQNATPRHPVDKNAIKRKMQKLKDLYLSDLIDREMYESDYTELRKALEAPEPEDREEIDIGQLRSALGLYDDLEPPDKHEFWCRTLKKISIQRDGEINFTVRIP